MKILFLLAGLLAAPVRASDRINLWPFFYHEAGKTSVMWPLYEDNEEGWAFRPLVGVWGKGRSIDLLWPVGSLDYAKDDFRFFPFFWGRGRFAAFPFLFKGRDYLHVWPLFYHRGGRYTLLLPFGGRGTEPEFTAVLPPLFVRSGGRQRSTDLFWPLVNWKDGPETGWRFANLYGSYRSDKEARTFALWPLYQKLSGPEGGVEWVFPFYAKGFDPGSSWWLAAPGVFSRRGADGSSRLFLSPLFGSGEAGGTRWSSLLGPLYLRRFRKQGSVSTLDLAWPVFQRTTGEDVEGLRFWPLGGYRKEGAKSSAFALWPLYWRSATPSRTSNVVFPLYWDIRDNGPAGLSSRRLGVFPLFTYSRERSAKTVSFLWPLAWSRTGEDGGRRWEFLWRLFDYESKPEGTQTRVLWRLFRYARKGEAVDVDVFPFVSYHGDGRGSETSFLWRVFRYEKSPEGRRLTLLFIPVY